MSGLTHGIGCGVVLGIVGVLLAQQFGLIELSNLGPALTYLVVGAILGAILFGLIGWALGRRALANRAALTAAPPSN